MGRREANNIIHNFNIVNGFVMDTTFMKMCNFLNLKLVLNHTEAYKDNLGGTVFNLKTDGMRSEIKKYLIKYLNESGYGSKNLVMYCKNNGSASPISEANNIINSLKNKDGLIKDKLFLKVCDFLDLSISLVNKDN